MEAICKLKDVYKALYTFEKMFSDTNGITINEGMILCCMKDEKSKTANELCGFIGLSNSRVSRVINSVEAKGYIKREIGAVDKRQMVFSLTDNGRAKISEMLKHDIDFSQIGKQLLKLAEQ